MTALPDKETAAYAGEPGMHAYRFTQATLTDSQRRHRTIEREERLVEAIRTTRTEMSLLFTSPRRHLPDNLQKLARLSIELAVLCEVAGIAYDTDPDDQ